MRPSTFGKKMALCQAFTYARRRGTSVAMTSEDNFCTPSTGFHRWEDIAIEDLIESQARQGWHKDIEAEKKGIEAAFELLGDYDIKNLREYCGLICSPLTETGFIPDSVLVYGDGFQLTHIIHALSYEFKHVPNSSFEGFGKSCMKGGLIPFITQRPQIVIPGMGDRSFAGISEHEIGIGMPSSLLFYVMDNIFKTGGKMNMGYPMKFMINMDLNENLTPGFKFIREKMDKNK